jgi:hypothetical protein
MSSRKQAIFTRTRIVAIGSDSRIRNIYEFDRKNAGMRREYKAWSKIQFPDCRIIVQHVADDSVNPEYC